MSQTLRQRVISIVQRPWAPGSPTQPGLQYPVAAEAAATQLEKTMALAHSLALDSLAAITPDGAVKVEPTLNEIDAAITAWNAFRTLAFTSGGTTQLLPGYRVLGHTSAATAYLSQVQATSGTWAGGDRAGNFYLRGQTGAFQAENLDLISSAGTVLVLNVATIGGNSSAISAIARANVRADYPNSGLHIVSVDTSYIYVLPKAYEVSALGTATNPYIVGAFFVQRSHSIDANV